MEGTYKGYCTIENEAFKKEINLNLEILPNETKMYSFISLEEYEKIGFHSHFIAEEWMSKTTLRNINIKNSHDETLTRDCIQLFIKHVQIDKDKKEVRFIYNTRESFLKMNVNYKKNFIAFQGTSYSPGIAFEVPYNNKRLLFNWGSGIEGISIWVQDEIDTYKIDEETVKIFKAILSLVTGKEIKILESHEDNKFYVDINQRLFDDNFSRITLGDYLVMKEIIMRLYDFLTKACSPIEKKQWLMAIRYIVTTRKDTSDINLKMIHLFSFIECFCKGGLSDNVIKKILKISRKQAEIIRQIRNKIVHENFEIYEAINNRDKDNRLNLKVKVEKKAVELYIEMQKSINIHIAEKIQLDAKKINDYSYILDNL